MSVLVETGHINEYPYNHARILYGNVVTAVSATGAVTNFPAALALTDETYERWSPSVSGDSITATFPAQNVNAIALAAHSNLNPTVEIRTANGVFETVTAYPFEGPSLSSDFTLQDYGIVDYSPDNEAILFLIKPRYADAVRITVTYTGTAPTLGVLRVGNVLEMQRPFYQRHKPAMLAADATLRPNISESGEWLGASLIRQGRSLNYSWQNLKADWVRKNWVPFAQSLKTKPFIIAWNPKRFSADCFYASSSTVPRPNNSGPLNYQTIDLSARGYSDGTDPTVENLAMATFDELFTFTRSTTATYYDIGGVLQTAAIDEPRFTYDPDTNEAEGLLIEEQRTRLNTVAAAPTSPEGVTVTAVAHTVSFFGTGTVTLSGVFSGSLVGTGASDRATLTFTPTAGTLTLTPSGTVENLQLEAGSFETSVILGEGSQVTRAADDCVRTLGDEFNNDAFTVYFEGTLTADAWSGTSGRFYSFAYISDGTTDNGYFFRQGADFFQLKKRLSGVIEEEVSISSVGEPLTVKTAYSRSGSSIILAVNGVSNSTSESTETPVVSQIEIGGQADGALFVFNGTVEGAQIIPRALTQSELEDLTA